MKNRNIKAFGGLIFLFATMAALLFLPAWTLNFTQAWIFLAVFFLAALVITLYLMKKDPKLLERRVQAGPIDEKEANQKIIQTITTIGFISMLVLPAFDYRLHWLVTIPFSISILGDVLVVIGLFIIFLVFKENTFASGTIELAPDQKVVSTGLYALVRHPMYMGALVMFIGMILALGSWLGLIVFILMMPALIWRLFDEEKFLTKNLLGYSEYQKNVKYHLLPFIW